MARQQAVLDELGATRGEEADRARGAALWKMGEASFRLRRMADAANQLEEAERAFARVPGFDLPGVRARLARAGALLVLRRYKEAAELAEDVLWYGKKAQNSYYIRAGGITAALGSKGAGRWQEAATAATAFLDDLGSDPPAEESSRVAVALVIQAAAARLNGRPEEALRLLERAIPLAAEGDDREQLYQAMDVRAASLYSAGRPSEARAAYDEIVAEFRDESDEFATAAVWGSRAWKLRIRIRPHNPPRPRTQRRT